MTKWLRKHHWLHDWGQWHNINDGWWVQVSYCNICHKCRFH